VPRIALTAKEPMALNATVEPMFIKLSSVVIEKVSITLLRGMFQPGLTYKVNLILVSTNSGCAL
jgi:hypothetical protein